MKGTNIRELVLNNKRILRLSYNGKAIWPTLPPGYTRVAYLTFTDEQYVDTRFVANQDTRVICRFRYTGGTGVYGARTSVSSRNFSMRVINKAWQIGYGNGVLTGTISSDSKWHVADHNKNELYIDGVLAASRPYEEFTTPRSMAIGGIRGSSLYGHQGDCAEFIVFDNGKLAQYWVQCVNNDTGEAGYYDLIGRTFEGNSGTGVIGYTMFEEI